MVLLFSSERASQKTVCFRRTPKGSLLPIKKKNRSSFLHKQSGSFFLWEAASLLGFFFLRSEHQSGSFLGRAFWGSSETHREKRIPERFLGFFEKRTPERQPCLSSCFKNSNKELSFLLSVVKQTNYFLFNY